MAKVKVKKQSTFIDMTAMSDVTVLLLTFFMLTSTFLPKEPVQVITPASVSEVKIPEYNVLNILIDPQGRVFISMDKPEDKVAVLQAMGKEYGVTFDNQQVKSFVEQSHVGVPMNQMSAFLKMPATDQNDAMKKLGVPADSTNNQLARWVQNFTQVNEDASIAIKADQSTPFPYVDRVMKTLSEVKQNRYSLITTLKGMPEGL